MSRIIPHYMNLDEAISKKMDDDAWKAYMAFHEISITRRDD